MAPRSKESFENFLLRLEKALKEGLTEIRYGRHHFSHAVCVEEGVLRVRRLEHPKEEAEAYFREHGMFMRRERRGNRQASHTRV